MREYESIFYYEPHNVEVKNGVAYYWIECVSLYFSRTRWDNDAIGENLCVCRQRHTREKGPLCTLIGGGALALDPTMEATTWHPMHPQAREP